MSSAFSSTCGNVPRTVRFLTRAVNDFGGFCFLYINDEDNHTQNDEFGLLIFFIVSRRYINAHR